MELGLEPGPAEQPGEPVALQHVLHVPGQLQVLLEAAQNGDERGRPGGGGAGERDLDGHPAAVAAQRLDAHGPVEDGLGRDGGEAAAVPLAVLRRHEEVGDLQADGLLLGPPERPLRGGVPLDDHAGPVGHDDGVVADGQHGLVPAPRDRGLAARALELVPVRVRLAGHGGNGRDGPDGGQGRFGRGRHPGCLGSRARRVKFTAPGAGPPRRGRRGRR